jgi:glycosyltransferase involved in cell wall biosynthesis
MSLVSILIPSRNERFLVSTVNDLLSKATGEIEIVVVQDGYWDPNLPRSDKRIKELHHGRAKGMRPALNAAAEIAKGDFLLKCDAHTMWDVGFDEKLKNDYHEDNWVLTPRRYALDPEKWEIETGNPKYPVDAHFLSNPYERPNDPTCGMHGTPWTARREARKDVLLDEEMSSQGSAWFMSRKNWNRVAPMDIEQYGNFYMEMQELGLKTWMLGGAHMITKNTWYAHLRKGQKYGRGYALGPEGHRRGHEYGVDFWMKDKLPGAVRTMRWLVERFAPVPTWQL